MKILEQILYRDFTPGVSAYMLEIPANGEFLPCLVSNTRGDFVVSSRLTSDSKLRCGFFNHLNIGENSILHKMIQDSYNLSKNQSWQNIFSSLSEAHKYIRETSLLVGQPHCLLYPSSFEESSLLELCEDGELTRKDGDILAYPWMYKQYTRVLFCNVPFPTFLSRPDYVGLLHVSNNYAAIALHNVELGMSFLIR